MAVARHAARLHAAARQSPRGSFNRQAAPSQSQSGRAWEGVVRAARCQGRVTGERGGGGGSCDARERGTGEPESRAASTDLAASELAAAHPLARELGGLLVPSTRDGLRRDHLQVGPAPHQPHLLGESGARRRRTLPASGGASRDRRRTLPARRERPRKFTCCSLARSLAACLPASRVHSPGLRR